ncbi:Sec-independent protein translocase protein TatB [Chelativorans sp. Marseille-P2723]|uniref:Sec-independent protein translocase protein TatB n=1 Tax=Chelativorans sp. Marseille-P2723 TaxID=2709133 RepID=UPI00156F7748|nr:Sec-independent protein translocase protein TatB [Chelativorans sp. Marseille-P2723]
MFDLGWSEILVIAIVLIVIVGPKDLPKVLRSFGRTTAKLRVMAGDFRKQFDEALREAELDEVKGLVDDVRKLDPRKELRQHLSPLEQAGRDIRSSLDEAAKPKPEVKTEKAESLGAAASEAAASAPEAAAASVKQTPSSASPATETSSGGAASANEPKAAPGATNPKHAAEKAPARKTAVAKKTDKPAVKTASSARKNAGSGT